MTETESQSSPTQSQSTKIWVQRAFFFALFAAGAVAIAWAMRPQPAVVEVHSAHEGELVATVNEDGTARIHDRYIISAPLGGTLARISLHPGDEVEQGQVVARLLPLFAPLLDLRSRTEAQARVDAALASVRQAKAQIERAKATVDFAKKDAENTLKLLQSGTISELERDQAALKERSANAELASAQFAAKVASHELVMARSALSRFEKSGTDQDDQFEITSPTTGRVLHVIERSEGVVQPGTPLLEIGDPKALEIAVDVLTSDAVSISPGARVTIERWGGEPLGALVRMVEPSAFEQVSALGVKEQRVNALIDLKDPYEKWQLLGDGYRVEAQIEVYRNPRALLIPWSALFRRDDGWATYVVAEQDNGSHRAELRAVSVGKRNDTFAEITRGLAAKTRVIVHPSDSIESGSLVSANKNEPANKSEPAKQ